MDNSLIKIGLYGSRTMVLVGDTDLFALRGVDLITRQIHFHQEERNNYHAGADSCTWELSPYLKEGGVICRNGILGRPRAHFTIARLVEYINQLGVKDEAYIISAAPAAKGLIPITNGIISVIGGRPFLARPEGGGLILKGRDFVQWLDTRRINPVDLEEVDLTGNGFFMAPSIAELRDILDLQVGFLCDPYAPKDQIIKGVKVGPKHLMVPWPKKEAVR